MLKKKKEKKRKKGKQREKKSFLKFGEKIKFK